MDLSEWYKLLRSSEDRKKLLTTFKTTAGLCSGYVQVNVAIIPAHFAEHFENFCNENPGPCPIIHQESLGQEIPETQEDLSKFNVRTDVLQCIKWVKGLKETDLDNLKDEDFSSQPFVSFYLGCSFTFDDELINAGIPCKHVLNRGVVSMYESSIEMRSVGLFGGKMVVSMRPIRKEHLHQVIQTSFTLPKCHGLPIQIGSPFMIGIQNLNSPFAGDLTVVDSENEVPVFWCCGVSSQNAIKAAKINVCYSHAPGKMAILNERVEKYLCENKNIMPAFFVLRDEPFFASILSTTALKLIQKIEGIISSDPGNRGIKNCIQHGSLVRSALALSHSFNVAIITGFPVSIPVGGIYEYENDGITGSLLLGETLANVGKNVEIFIDSFFLNRYLQLWENSAIRVTVKSLSDFNVEKFDHVISIERPGRSRLTERYHFMSGKEITQIFDFKISQSAFEDAFRSKTCFTTSIADGGNELGSGSVYELVRKYVQNGDTISVDSLADYLLLSGTSNWGAFGLAQSLYVLECCGIHQFYKHKGIGVDYTVFEPRAEFLQQQHSRRREGAFLELLGQNGIVDGIS